MKQNQVEDQLFPFFDGVAPKNERVLSWLIKAMKESHKDEIGYNTQKRESFNRIIRTADKRIEEAYKDKLDGKMPATLCEKMIKDTIKEKEEAIENLSKLSQSRTAYYEAGYAIHELALKAKAIYESPKAKTEDKRLLLSYVFSNLELNENRISPNYTLAFEFLAEWMPKMNKIFEPTQKATKSGLLCDFSVKKSGNSVAESLEPRIDFRTSRNPDFQARFASSSGKSRLLLAWQASFRTFEWLKGLADPATIIKQTGQLLALV